MDSLATSIGELLLDPKYADLEIQCGGKRFLVHRPIVCKRSRVIERECDGLFQESWTRIIKHDVYDFRAVDRMLQYIYSSDYKLEPCTPWTYAADVKTTSREVDTRDEDEEPLIAHVYVYAIADYYDVPGLKTLAEKKFVVERDTSEALAIDKILAIAVAMYKSTSGPCTLRRLLMELCHSNVKVTIQNKVFLEEIARRDDLQEFRRDFFAWQFERVCQEKKDDVATYQTAVKSITDDLDTAKVQHYARIAQLRQEQRELEAAHAKEKDELQTEITAGKFFVEQAHKAITKLRQEKADLVAARSKEKEQLQKEKADLETAHSTEKQQLQEKVATGGRLATLAYSAYKRDNELRLKQEKAHTKTVAELNEAKNAFAKLALTRLEVCPHCSAPFDNYDNELKVNYRQTESVHDIKITAKCRMCGKAIDERL